MNVGLYINYFRKLAVTHALIQHDVLAETGNGDPGKKRFTVFGNNEVIAGLRTTIGYPAILLELYDTNINSEIVYDIRQNKTGAFMVLDHAEEGNTIDEQTVYVRTEKIVYDILRKIWQDHYGKNSNGKLIERCASPFKLFNFKSLEITPTGKLFTSEYGWYVQFSFTMQNEPEMNAPPEEGIFIPENYLVSEDGIPLLSEDGQTLLTG